VNGSGQAVGGAASGGIAAGPVLKTARLRLRPYGWDDAPAMTAFLADFEVARWLALVPHPYGPEHARSFLEKTLGGGFPDKLGLAIEVDGRLAGGIALAGLSALPMLGYWLGPPHWGRGLMTEAVAAVLAHGFGTLGLTRVGSGIFAGNEASLAIQRRAGFEVVGQSEVFSLARNTTVTHIDTRLTRRRWQETKR